MQVKGEKNMSRTDFDKPAHLINLDKKLTIKDIKYIMNNLHWNRHEYAEVKELWNKYFRKTPEEIDFDLIESLQAIYKYSDNYVKLCQITNIFNTFVKVKEHTGFYEALSYGEDKTYSLGYELNIKIPNELKGKLIKYGQKIMKDREEMERSWYY